MQIRGVGHQPGQLALRAVAPGQIQRRVNLPRQHGQRRVPVDHDQRLAPGSAGDHPLGKPGQLARRSLHAPGARAPLAERLRQRRTDAELGQRLDDRGGQQLVAAAGLLHPRVALPPAEAQAPRVQRRRASAGQPLDGRHAGGASQLEDLWRSRVAQVEPADRDRRAPWPPQPQRLGAVARRAIQQRMGDRDVEGGVVLGVLVERGQAPTTAANSDSIVSPSSA